jgi:hypothetical protein
MIGSVEIIGAHPVGSGPFASAEEMFPFRPSKWLRVLRRPMRLNSPIRVMAMQPSSH